jgi:hypothetical protein
MQRLILILFKTMAFSRQMDTLHLLMKWVYPNRHISKNPTRKKGYLNPDGN